MAKRAQDEVQKHCPIRIDRQACPYSKLTRAISAPGQEQYSERSTESFGEATQSMRTEQVQRAQTVPLLQGAATDSGLSAGQ